MVSPAPSAIDSTGCILSTMPALMAVSTTFFMPIAWAMRTVMVLRDSSRPRRIGIRPR